MIINQARPGRAQGQGRLLLCNVGRIGDTILGNAILDSAFRTFAHVDYLCGRHNADLLRADARLGRVIPVPNLVTGFLRLLKTLMFSHYDAYIDLKDHASTTGLIIARFVRAAVKTGFNQRYLKSFQRNTEPLQYPRAHKVEVVRRIGALAELEPGDYKPFVSLPEDSVKRFSQQHSSDAPFIFINVSASSANRMWPVENWKRYVRGCGLSGENILVGGVPEHRGMVQQLCDAFPRAMPYRARHFMDVVAALDRAHLVLSVDTGVVHACSALDKPLVTFFRMGRTNVTHAPLSTWQLVIRSATGVVSDIDPGHAVEETRKRGLRPPFAFERN